MGSQWYLNMREFFLCSHGISASENTQKKFLSYSDVQAIWSAPLYSISGKYNSLTCYTQIFIILASLCCWVVLNEPYQLAKPEDRFSRDEALFLMIGLIPLMTIYIYCDEVICFISEKERAMRARHERGRADRSRNRTRSRSRERRKYQEESRSLSRHSESSRREFT